MFRSLSPRGDKSKIKNRKAPPNRATINVSSAIRPSSFHWPLSKTAMIDEGLRHNQSSVPQEQSSWRSQNLFISAKEDKGKGEIQNERMLNKEDAVQLINL